ASVASICTVATTRWVPGSSAPAVWVRLWRIDSDDDHERPPVRHDGERDGGATCRLPAPGEGTPLLSQAAARDADRRGKSREGQPEGGRRFTSQAGRCPGGILDHLPARPVHLIQVGG